jgi:hypothetical protein
MPSKTRFTTTILLAVAVIIDQSSEVSAISEAGKARRKKQREAIAMEEVGPMMGSTTRRELDCHSAGHHGVMV